MLSFKNDEDKKEFLSNIVAGLHIMKVSPEVVEKLDDNGGKQFFQKLLLLFTYNKNKKIVWDLESILYLSSQIALTPKLNSETIFISKSGQNVTFEALKTNLLIGPERTIRTSKDLFPYSFYQKLGLYGASKISCEMGGNSFYHIFVKEAFSDTNGEFTFFCSPLMINLPFKDKYIDNIKEVAENFTDHNEQKAMRKPDPNKQIRDWSLLIKPRVNEEMKIVVLPYLSDNLWSKYFKSNEYDTEIIRLTPNPAVQQQNDETKVEEDNP